MLKKRNEGVHTYLELMVKTFWKKNFIMKINTMIKWIKSNYV